MKEYYKKYLKYKKKYTHLKNQKAGNPYYIINFHKNDTVLAMAEAITKENLADKMTSHGLGTGIYGFINASTENSGTSGYSDREDYSQTSISMTNPLILENIYILNDEEQIIGKRNGETLLDNRNREMRIINAIVYHNLDNNNYELIEEVDNIIYDDNKKTYNVNEILFNQYEEMINNTKNIDYLCSHSIDDNSLIKLPVPLIIKNYYLKRKMIIHGDNKKISKPGDNRTDLDYFIALSTNLNKTCYELYKRLLTRDIVNIESIDICTFNSVLCNHNRPYSSDNSNQYNLTGTVTVHDDILLESVKNFLKDYTILMSRENDNNYVLMPINYLLMSLGYDGIYNLNGDSASLGSVKYFTTDYSARGYKPDEKLKPPLQGELIKTNLFTR